MDFAADRDRAESIMGGVGRLFLRGHFFRDISREVWSPKMSFRICVKVRRYGENRGDLHT